VCWAGENELPLSDNPGCGIKRVRDFSGCMGISGQAVGACEMPGMMFTSAVVANWRLVAYRYRLRNAKKPWQ